jgi:hypothetical protein
MYFMLESFAGLRGQPAQLEYEPDDPWRIWTLGERFENPPPEPVLVTIEHGDEGIMLDLWDAVISLMTKRLANALTQAGVSNIDFYQTEIREVRRGKVHDNYLAFNLIGTVAAADLSKSEYLAPDGPLISVDFDSLVIDESKTRGALMFRLAESVNGIVVHESVKNAIEAAGIDTLTFIPPEEWVG